MDVPPSTSRSALARRVVSLVDLTDLDDDHRSDGIDDLVERAVEHGCAAVCVWPEFVARCDRRRRELADGSAAVRIATVVDFPAGGGVVADAVAAAAGAIAEGADEIDLVLPHRSFAAGDEDRARAMVSAVARAVHGGGAHLKVILETGELGDADLVRAAARLAVEEGADFLKTSTGKTSTGATLEALAALVDVVVENGGRIGLKPSGGIRTLDDAAAYLALVDERLGAWWATPESFRFGASGLLAAAVAEL